MVSTPSHDAVKLAAEDMWTLGALAKAASATRTIVTNTYIHIHTHTHTHIACMCAMMCACIRTPMHRLLGERLHGKSLVGTLIH